MTRISLCLFLSASAALFGCHRNHREDAAANTTANATDTVTRKSEIRITDEELTRLLAWMREDMAISTRFREETRVTGQEAMDRAAPGEDGSKDPQVNAMLDRQRREMQAHKDAMPLDEERARALSQTIAGIGVFKLDSAKQDEPLVFVPYRNDRALEEARAKYGDPFVQWVVSRESKIVETLTR